VGEEGWIGGVVDEFRQEWQEQIWAREEAFSRFRGRL